MKETYIEKLKRLNSDITKNIPNVGKLDKLLISLDFLKEKILHEVELIDYMQYEFYLKNRRGRDRYVYFGRLLKIMRKCNNPAYRDIFDSKPLFNKTFSDYLGREWMELPGKTEDEFKSFLERNDVIFVKHAEGMYGKGVELLHSKEVLANIEEEYIRLSGKKVLIETAIVQHESLAQFNNSSVNSFRVVTLLDDHKEVHVMAGVLRVGRAGKIADNFHHYGIAAVIDVDTGIVKSTGVDRDFNRYVVHPDTKVPIVGYQVIKWDEIVNTAKAAACIVKEVRYVGWDVTVDIDGNIVIIEGNPGADPDVTQIPDKTGKWEYYKEFI